MWTWEVAEGLTIPVDEALRNYYVSVAGEIGGGWIYTAIYVLVWWLILFGLYRKRLFVRV